MNSNHGLLKLNVYLILILLLLFSLFTFSNVSASLSNSTNYNLEVITFSTGANTSSTNYKIDVVSEISGVTNSTNYISHVGLFYASGNITYPAPTIEHQIVFVNYSIAHSFNVTAGAYSQGGASAIISVVLNGATCTNTANSTSGNYVNSTFTCTGTPFTNETVSMEFCDEFNQCATTSSASNKYPNQVPTMGSLQTPTNGNLTVHDLRPTFTWTAGNDDDSDTINYTFNLTTNVNCEPILPFNTTSLSFTPSQDLCPDSLKIYTWTVRACDTWNCSTYHTTWNFTLEPFIDILFVNDGVNFGVLEMDSTHDTADDSPTPFHIKNNGNVYCDLVNVSASQSLWDTVGLDTSYFQIKARMPSGNDSFNITGSQMSWANVSSSEISLIDTFNHTSGNNSAFVDIGVTVPGSEPPGSKSTTLTFVWEETPVYSS